MIHTTPNVVIERLQEASCDATAASLTRHFDLESDLLRGRQPIDAQFKKTIALNSPATYPNEIAELLPFLDSPNIADRLIGSFKVHSITSAPQVVSSMAPTALEDIVQKCVKVVSTDLLRYPVLLDPRLGFHLRKRQSRHTVMERLLRSHGLRLPSTRDGFTTEALTDFAAHRSTFEHLRPSTHDLALSSLLEASVDTPGVDIPVNWEVCLGLIELSSLAQAAARQGKTPKRIPTDLILDNPETLRIVTRQLGEMILFLACPAQGRYVHSDSASALKVAAEAVGQRRSELVKSAVHEGVSSALFSRIDREQPWIQAGAGLVTVMVEVGMSTDRLDALQFAVDQVIYANARRPADSQDLNLVANVDPCALIHYLECAHSALCLEPPWVDFVKAIDHASARLGDTRIQMSAETALRARAQAQEMAMAIDQQRQESAVPADSNGGALRTRRNML